MTGEQIITALLWSLFGAAIAIASLASQINRVFKDGWDARKEWEEIERRFYKPEEDEE